MNSLSVLKGQGGGVGGTVGQHMVGNKSLVVDLSTADLFVVLVQVRPFKCSNSFKLLTVCQVDFNMT